MESQMLLRDPEIFPSNNILKNALGDRVYSVFESFLQTITSQDFGLTIKWRFYNDGKAWLGKIVNKKKTILWISIWEGLFKVSFYFTEKNRDPIAQLDISEFIKQKFAQTKPAGKLIPMIFDVKNTDQLQDLLTIVWFKNNFK